MTNLNAVGFIVDSPRALIKTKNEIKSILNASSGEITFSGDTLEINGGNSSFPIQEIDTKSNIEIKLTDTEFSLDTMKMTSGGTITTGAIEYDMFGFSKTIDSNSKIVIPKVAIAGSMTIDGYTETTQATPGANEFKVTISPNSTEVLFADSEIGKTVYPAYKISIAEGTALTVKSTDVPSSGEIYLEFPVFADPESDSSDIVGYTQIVIYKGKIKKDMKIGSSYKTASSFDITIKGLDPKREDGAIWSAKFISKEDYLG